MKFSLLQHIALYISTDGELDTLPLIEWLWRRKVSKLIYSITPLLLPDTCYFFIILQTFTTVLNKYGIVEPQARSIARQTMPATRSYSHTIGGKLTLRDIA